MSHRIGMDVRMIRRTGIGTYVRGLLAGWKEAGVTKDLDLALYGNDLSSNGNAVYPTFSFQSPIYSVREQIEYPWHLKDCKLWHAPHYNVPVVKGGTKLVVTIHDLIHWIFRKQFLTPVQEWYAQFMLNRAVSVADHVITVSEKTKKDLVTHFDAPADKISVIYEGVEPRFQKLKNQSKTDQVRDKYGIPKDYFLYIGLLKPHKNVLWLIRLFKKLRNEGRVGSSLVLVGKKDKKYPAGFEDLADLKSGDAVIHVPYVEDDDLIALYNGATALTHPSLYEGFGLTLLEAMACETPVIACRSASIPEVVGDAAWLVEPGDEKGMSEAIEALEKNSEKRNALIEKGNQRVTQFSWQDAARKTAQIYEKVLSR